MASQPYQLLGEKNHNFPSTYQLLKTKYIDKGIWKFLKRHLSSNDIQWLLLSNWSHKRSITFQADDHCSLLAPAVILILVFVFFRATCQNYTDDKNIFQNCYCVTANWVSQYYFLFPAPHCKTLICTTNSSAKKGVSYNSLLVLK